MAAKIIEKKLHVAGYMYVRSKSQSGKTYWDCRLVRTNECRARAITNDAESDEDIVLIKGPAESKHEHPPNREESAAAEITARVKRIATRHPEQPPSQVLRRELAGLSEGVLSQMPEQEALSKTIRRARRKNLPPNPRSLADLGEIPNAFRKSLLGETFLLHDSGPPEEDLSDDEDEDERTAEGGRRVLVFATRRNIEMLCESSIWFLDGTFKVAPTIFAQVFTIIGLRRRNIDDGEGVPIPLVYALLSGKSTDMYAEVLRVVRNAVEDFRIDPCVPLKIMSDFELGIINACAEVFPGVPVSCCFFHLGQSLYRRVQEEGLQVAYNDAEDRSIKAFTHSILALAFIPIDDVADTFKMLARSCPGALRPVLDYFRRTYIGVAATGRRRAIRPRYAVKLWNQYDAARNKSHRTNNASEGWHNRYRIVVGKHHPDLYSALTEFQKEQAYSEACLAELALGKRVKTAPKKKWVDLQNRIQSIADQYETYKNGNKVLEYLRTLGYNVTLT